MSRGVQEVAVTKGSQRWMRKHERGSDSEVTVKKTPMKRVDNEGKSESDPLFRVAAQRFKITHA